MKQLEILSRNLPAILEIARFAPSVHNTQPWQVSADDEGLKITIDPDHKLHDGDPTGRQTIISLGIFCEAIGIATADLGLSIERIELQDSAAVLTFAPAAIDSSAHTTVSLLKTRSSDRSIYKPAVIQPQLIQTLQATSKSDHTTVHVVTDSKIIDQVADLTGHAIGVALSSPAFRAELAQYLVTPHSKQQRGIATKSLYIHPLLQRLEPFMLRHGINLGAEAKLETKRWLSASGLVVITAPGDMPQYWLEVGRTYLRASLAIEAAGLSQATSAAVVEASNYHDDVEESLGTTQRILAVIRIGEGSPKRHYSPRVSAQTLLTSSQQLDA